MSFLLVACEEKIERTDQAPAATPPPVVGTPTPVPTATPEPVHEIKAGDVLYLKKRASLVSDSGVRGFAPGSKIKVISRTGNVLKVSVEDAEIEVDIEDTLTGQESGASPQAATPPPVDAAAAKARQDQLRKQYNDRLAQQAIESQRAVRNRRLAEIDNMINQIFAQRTNLWNDVYSKYRNPDGNPAARAKLAEVARMDALMDQLRAEASQLRSQR